MHEQVTANPESPVRSSATLFMSHLQSSHQQLNHGRVPRVCHFIVCALTADVRQKVWASLASLLPNCPGVGASQGATWGSSSSWTKGIRAPDLLTWSQRPAPSDGCAVASGQVLCRLARPAPEWTRLVSERRSLSFNHNGGLRPGPSHSCCLRPSSCVFRTPCLWFIFPIVRSLPTALAILIPPLISTRPFYLWLSGPARPSLLSVAQTSWCGAAAVLLRCCRAP